MTPEHIETLKTLRELLNGRCSTKKTTCPSLIFGSPLHECETHTPSYKKMWTCGNCIQLFGFIKGFFIPHPDKRNPCPCTQKLVNKDEIFLLLDEYTGNGPLDGGSE